MSPLTAGAHASPVSVAIVSPQEVVVEGLRAILAEMPGVMSVVTDEFPPVDEPDVVLYDVIGLHEGEGRDLDRWLKETGSVVVVVARDLRPDLAAAALERGAAGSVSIGATADELLGVIASAVSGELSENPVAQTVEDRVYAGADSGLSPREAEVLGLIVLGLSNDDIAQHCFLSINSVKTYIRSTYRKIDAPNRSAAVIWAIQHGFPTSGTRDEVGPDAADSHPG